MDDPSNSGVRRYVASPSGHSIRSQRTQSSSLPSIPSRPDPDTVHGRITKGGR